MAAKPSELEQKAEDSRKLDLERKQLLLEQRVTALETEIDAFLVKNLPQIRTKGSVEYGIRTEVMMYGGDPVPKEVVAEVAKRYEAAGWTIRQKEQDYKTYLTFELK